MQLLVDIEEVSSAPIAVRDWFYSRLGTAPKVEPEVVESPATEAVPVDVSIDELLQKAVALIEAKGEDVLKAILEKVGVKRVKECPADKRAALLAEIAVHA